jgi:hypothetical protein
MTLQGRPGAHLQSAPKGQGKSKFLVEDRLLRLIVKEIHHHGIAGAFDSPLH